MWLKAAHFHDKIPAKLASLDTAATFKLETVPRGSAPLLAQFSAKHGKKMVDQQQLPLVMKLSRQAAGGQGSVLASLGSGSSAHSHSGQQQLHCLGPGTAAPVSTSSLS